MATSALQFSHVTLGYENIITTSDLNLTIPQGDYLCIIGENGSGKSTFVKNLLGLVCDPVGGLVEVPCVKRNVIGAMDALSAAQMALAGIESRVPADQVLDAMAEVGRSLPHTLRETGKGGLAATPFGMEYAPKEP